VLVAWLTIGSQVAADEVDGIAAQIFEIEQEAKRLDAVVGEPEKPQPDAAQRRLLEAQVLFELKDYARASILFLDVVEQYADSRVYEDALYYLAESLLLVRNLRTARPYYLQIAARPRSPHYQAALARLVEIALRTGETAGVDDLIARMGEVAPDPRRPSAPYVRAKYLYFRGRVDEAVAAFDAIPDDHRYGRHARYFAGVCRVKKDDLEGAIESFGRLLMLESRSDGEGEILDLGRLALGRIRYELGRLRQAIEAYRGVSRESKFYETALHELAWVYIKDKQFENALRALDLLVLTAPDSPRVPEVRILQGNLLIRMQRFDPATKVFENTRDEYNPQYEELRGIMDGQADPLPYLEGLLGRPPRKAAPRLPRLAAAWAREQPEAKGVLDLLRDVEQLERDLQESSSILDQVTHAMRGPSRAAIFPDLALGHERATALVVRLATARDRLLTLDRSLMATKASRGEIDSIEDLARERKSLEARRQPWPRSAAKDSGKKAREAYTAAGRRLAALSVQVKGLREQLAAVEKYAEENRTTRGEEESFRQQAEGIRALITTLVAEEERLRAAIEEGERKLGAAGDDPERRTGNDYERVAAEERRRLQSLAGRLDPNGRRQHDRIEEVLTRAAAVQAALDRFGTALDARIEKRLEGIKQTVEKERAALERHQADAKAFATEARSTMASVARASFNRVLRRYYDIAVMGDVGILDVAWALKQERSDEVSQLVNEQKAELEILDDGLREIVEDTE